MIGLDDFRQRMRDDYKKTKAIDSVQVTGRNLDDALSQASVELSLPLESLEYEILGKTQSGIAGLGKTSCRIIAYKSVHTVEKKTTQDNQRNESLDNIEQEEFIEEDLNGRFSLRLGMDGAWLKVFPPKEDGDPVHIEEVLEKLHNRKIDKFNEQLVKNVVESAGAVPVKVGEFECDLSNSSLPSCEISKDDMKVYVSLTPPRERGTDLTAGDIRAFLENYNIIIGIKEEVLEEMEDFPEHNRNYLVAEGSNPVNGEDAKVIYQFETDPNAIRIYEREDGSVDFKDLRLHHNVTEGQILATKTIHGIGKDGQTVFGRFIAAKDGSDIDIGVGENVKLVKSGREAVAATSGHVMLKNGKIIVSAMLLIEGNVDARTGNIDILGSVEIKGNVEDGYSVQAGGKIEVHGFVGKSNLTAGSDIVVSRGINGGESSEFGHIKAKKSIWSSFIQNATVSADGFVIVSSGIVNTNLVSRKKVLCKGRRAKIVGGHIVASEEINAVVLGSTGGTLTRLEVGFDPILNQEIEKLEELLEALIPEKNKVDLNLKGIIHGMKKNKKSIPQPKNEIYLDLKKQHLQLKKKIKQLESEIESRQEKIKSLYVEGKISASRTVLSNVFLKICDTEYSVREEYKRPVTFILDKGAIRATRYQNIRENLEREKKR